MKRSVYIAAFIFLGLLLSTLLHAAIGMPTLWLITGDLATYGDSWVWQNWRLVHGIGGAALWILGVLLGFYFGKKYWQVLYVEQRFGKPKW